MHFNVSCNQGLSHDQYYVLHNGRLMQEHDVCSHGCIDVIPRLLGGKGGFGSMLRAIGAQIEKTTNREACRCIEIEFNFIYCIYIYI